MSLIDDMVALNYEYEETYKQYVKYAAELQVISVRIQSKLLECKVRNPDNPNAPTELSEQSLAKFYTNKAKGTA